MSNQGLPKCPDITEFITWHKTSSTRSQSYLIVLMRPLTHQVSKVPDSYHAFHDLKFLQQVSKLPDSHHASLDLEFLD